MMSPRGDPGLSQKKKMTTYGRAFRKREASAGADPERSAPANNVRADPPVAPRPKPEAVPSTSGTAAADRKRPKRPVLAQPARKGAPRPQQSSGDIFDVPASPPRSLPVPRASSAKSAKKVVNKYPRAKSPWREPAPTDVFDIPPSPDRSPGPTAELARAKSEKKPPKQYGGKEAPRARPPAVDMFDVPLSPKRALDTEGNGVAKRRKTSPPGRASPAKRSTTASSTPALPPTTGSPSKTARRARSPVKASLLKTQPATTTRDVVMQDAEAIGTAPAAARPVRPVKKPTARAVVQQPIPIRTQLTEAVSAPESKRRAPVVRREAAGKAPAKRRRLIDALAAQADESSEEEEEEEEPSSQRKTPELEEYQPVEVSTPSGSQTEAARVRTLVRQESSVKKTGPKFTYSQQRTMLSDSSSAGGGGGGGIPDFLLNESLFPTSNTSLDVPDEEEEAHSTGAMRSIHELRQAGANNRFADELDDLLDRVGSPAAKTSSARRNALLELAQKLHDKAFRRQFRDHGRDSGLFRDIGKETDGIAAYALVAILVTLLATTTSSHLTRLLRGQGFANTLSRLLSVSNDIVPVAKERRSNLSRHGQQTVAHLKSELLALPIWEPFTLENLSPRTLALRALEVVLQQQGELLIEEELFSSDVTGHLFSVLAGATEQKLWDWPPGAASHDLYIALSLLEARSVNAMQSDAGAEWTTKYLPTVADVLGTSLEHQSGLLNELEMLALKLTLNTANNNPHAPQVFVMKGLLRRVADSVCGTFESVMKSITGETFLSAVLESLVLMLGVMINCSEHDPAAGQTLLDVHGAEEPPLDKMIRLFLDHYAATAEADSVEKSQLNVAFGYLSLLLGYLCLYDPVRKRFTAMHKGGNLDPLLNSMREFIAYHQVADDAMAGAGQDPSRPFSSFTEKLMGLVNDLRGRR